MREERVLIGLTGNIATGKSVVSWLLAGLGAQVIDADRVAHEVMEPGGPAYSLVIEAFGAGILSSDGTDDVHIDRTKLGAIVFRDPAAMRRLERLVHPAVIAEVDRRIELATAPVIVVEAIKLIEAGMHRSYDALWVVTAPRHLQMQRLTAGRGLSEAEAALRIDAQPPQQDKAARADLVIVNDGDIEELQEKVKAAWASVQGMLDAKQARMRRSTGQERHATGPQHGEVSVRPVRRDDLSDAAGVAGVLNQVIAEGGQTALAGHWTAEAELRFLQSLGPRTEVFVAEVGRRIVGFQVIEPFVTYTSTMDHVAHFGTYVLASYRKRGIGRHLATATLDFARKHRYEKAVIYVLADNQAGLAYYTGLGFDARGTLRRQVKIAGAYHDEVFMELHFRAAEGDAA